MRILFVTRGFPPEGRWGSEGYAHDLALGLAAKGHEVEVFFPVPGGGSARVGQRSRPLGGIWVHPLELQRRPGKPFRDSYEDPRQDQALAELLERRGPFQRVHFTALGGEVSFGLVRAAKDHGAEVLVHLTEFLPWCHRGQLLDAELDDCSGPEARKCASCVLRPGPWGRRGVVDRMRRVAQRVLFTLGERTALASPAAFALREVEVAAALARVDRFFAPSEAIGLRAVELGLPADRVEVLPYALRAERTAGVTRPAPGPRLRVGYLSQIAPHKGLHVLVEALALLPSTRRRGLEVDVRGAATSAQHPGYGKALERRVRGAVLPLEFRGPFDPSELWRVLSGLDVVAIPSLWLENLPLVLLQARAAGLPVVASAVGGIAPFVREGEDALLFPPGDAPALSRCLAALLGDETLLPRLRAGAAAATLPADYAAQVARFAGEDDDEG